MAIRIYPFAHRPLALSTELGEISETIAVAGVSNRVPRADHQHAMPAGTEPHAQVHGSADHIINYATALSGVRVLTGTVSYTLVDTDGVIICDANAGAVTITLPAITATTSPPQAGSVGKSYAFYRIDPSNNDVKFLTTGSDVIDGDNHLPGDGQRVFLLADSSSTPKRWIPLTSNRGPLTVTKTSDTSRASTTTLAVDPHLTFPVESGATYMVQGLLRYQAGTTGDFKMAIDAPGASTGGWSTTGINGNSAFNQAVGTTNSLVPFGTSRSCGGAGASLDCALAFAAFVVAGAAGNVSVEWAQDVSDATASILKAGSALWYQRI